MFLSFELILLSNFYKLYDLDNELLFIFSEILLFPIFLAEFVIFV